MGIAHNHSSTIILFSSSVVLLLALSALSSVSGDVNIDCGSDSSDPYTDEVGRKWVGDTAYTQSGKSANVIYLLSDDHMLNTLRYFPTGKKNCYSVAVPSNVPQQQIIVGATFYYGNYDGKSSPPTFDLLLEGNPWRTVVTDEIDGANFQYLEALYVVKGSAVDVCVDQTSAGQIPFISALEIRSISTDMYKDFNADTAFILLFRSFFGTYPADSNILDSVGRIWFPNLPRYMINATSDATTNLPKEALRHAMTGPTTDDDVPLLPLTFLPTTSVPLYITVYFSELIRTTKIRSFDVYLDDICLTDEPIVPPYGSVLKYSIYNITANSSSELYLLATSDSDLPPLVNAIELYTVSNMSVQTEAVSNGSTTKNALPVSVGTKIPSVAGVWAIVGIFLWGSMY